MWKVSVRRIAGPPPGSGLSEWHLLGESTSFSYTAALIFGLAFRIARACMTTFSGTKCAYTIVILMSECPNRAASSLRRDLGFCW